MATAFLSFLSIGLTDAQESTVPPGDAQNDRAAVMQVLDRFIRSWNRDDVASFVGLFMTDGELATSEGTSKTQEEIRRVITETHPEIFFGTDLSEQVDSIRFLDLHRAEVTGHFILCCVPMLLGLETSRDGRFSLRLIDDNGEWKIERANIES